MSEAADSCSCAKSGVAVADAFTHHHQRASAATGALLSFFYKKFCFFQHFFTFTAQNVLSNWCCINTAL